MHEATIVAALVRQAAETARQHQAGRVVALRVKLSPQSHLSAAYLQDCFALLSSGTALEGARLDVEPMVEDGPGAAAGLVLDSLEVEELLPSDAPVSTQETRRLRLLVRGAVQGVGFRPFIYRLATELGLRGWVSNTAQGVCIEVEGAPDLLERFQARLEGERPALARIDSIQATFLEPAGYPDFQIRESDGLGDCTALVLPDIATCADCLREIFNPADRRYGYPFTNCTSCGPRFSIIQALPYDRANTTMQDFLMCRDCRAEYDNPQDRRFHAQPNACPRCGPHLELWDAGGVSLAAREAALAGAADALRRGGIVAVKGLGGFHLMADARNQEVVERLRRRKGREAKPFALMYPSLDAVKDHCRVSPLEETMLRSPESPIVLLRRNIPCSLLSQEEGGEGCTNAVAPSVAPGNPYLGVMLPYTPLHHLLLGGLGFPLVATSGNLSDEPICTDEHEALARLRGIADLFLMHNRPIFRPVDDSIVQVAAGRPQVLRRSRGYAPLPIVLPDSGPTVLAVGAHLKNAIALAVGGHAFLGQHVGDLDTEPAYNAFRQSIASLEEMYASRPRAVARDAHPDYRSSLYARGLGLPVVPVQHHHAHVLACLAEHGLEGPALGVAWDGTGYGPDGTVWGGEFLLVEGDSFRRAAHLRTFRLPGGEQAVREPRRSALGLLYQACGPDGLYRRDLAPVQAFYPEELRVLARMLERGVNSPVTSSMGRLFDAVAALLGLCQRASFEGQAAMALEFAAENVEASTPYDLPLREAEDGREGSPLVLDWEPMLRHMLEDMRRGTPAGTISARFHLGLAAAVVRVARQVGAEKVALTGGCFQNRHLTQLTVTSLGRARFRPYWHRLVPPNDGGIALGQLVAARRMISGR